MVEAEYSGYNGSSDSKETINIVESMTLEMVYERAMWGAWAALHTAQLIKNHAPTRLDGFLLDGLTSDGRHAHEHVTLRFVLREKDGSTTYEVQKDACPYLFMALRWTKILELRDDLKQRRLIDMEVHIGEEWYTILDLPENM